MKEGGVFVPLQKSSKTTKRIAELYEAYCYQLIKPKDVSKDFGEKEWIKLSDFLFCYKELEKKVQKGFVGVKGSKPFKSTCEYVVLWCDFVEIMGDRR